MSEDTEAYIPEPDAQTATGVLEAPRSVRALTPMATQGDDMETALHTWQEQRKIVQRFLKQELRPDIDYYQLKFGKQESKPSLSKAGSEKVLGWLRWAATFTPDTGTWEMLGRPTNVVCYLCTLRTRSGEVIGEGRGARSTTKDNDLNKSIKMAQKSAQVDAVLRTGCLSDVFTQDVEDMKEEPPQSQPARTTSQDLRAQIWALVQAQAPHLKGRDEVAAWVKGESGFDLHPDNYQQILIQLEKF